MNCTWVYCKNEASHELKDKFGIPWANICEEHFTVHEKAVEEAVKDPNENIVRRMIGIWIKAQGGSKKAAERI